MDFRVIDFNAKGDGKTSDTKAINNAIFECNKNGGGRVVFDADKIYRSGMIRLLSNVELYFEAGSKLMAVDDLSEFDIYGIKDKPTGLNAPTWENCDYSGQPTKFFIYAKGAKNISINGSGSIDGNEEIFYGNVNKWHIDGYFYPRVPLIFFEDCENVKIENVTLQRSGFWTTHLVGCRKVIVDSLRIINSLRLANCDGIDPDHCQDVIIRNCYIEAADDCIVFKTTEGARKYGDCKNIEVYNCTLMSTSAAIKFGTESVSNFDNIYIHDCNIIKSNRGISFQLRDEGNITNIKFENINIETRRFSPIHWWGKAEPISITAVKRRRNSILGQISNVEFININADSENGIFIHGDINQNISNLIFKNIEISIKSKTDWDKDTHDLRPSEEYNIIHNPINIIYSKNARDILFEGLRYNIFDNIKEYCGDIIYKDNVNNLIIK